MIDLTRAQFETECDTLAVKTDFIRAWEALAKHVSAREEISFKQDGREYNVGEKIALVHSELSEALEAYRKNLMDDHLCDRPGLEVELADAIIRIMGIDRHLMMAVGEACIEKAVYNDHRADHKPEGRSQEHGKRF